MNTFPVRSFALVLPLLAFACAAAPADAPSSDDDSSIDAQQLIYSTNSAGTWSANALTPTQYPEAEMTASATFTGPAGSTRKMGVCALRATSTACTTVADCASSPATLPAGGSRYCTSPNGAGQKHCYYRPGAATTYCAGSPANGAVAVAPGTYVTPTYFSGPGSIAWISYACFEGCSATDPSSSSAAVNNFTCMSDGSGHCI